MQIKKKIILSSFFGNALEFYDFTLYGVFAATLAKTFFPNDNQLTSLLMSWGAFAAGFIMRPFGASFFGYLGDKFGRKTALSLSILLMGIPTLMIGLLPSYATLGLLAPILVILCRLMQGLCTGGEYNGAAIFSLEHSLRGQRGLISGIITSSCVFGALTATSLGALFVKTLGSDSAWRLLFILGSSVSIMGFFMRRTMPESPEFKATNGKQKYFKHLLETIFSNKEAFVLSTTLGGLNGILSYTLFGFLNMWLTRYHGFDLPTAMFANVFGLLAFFSSSIVSGKVFDIMGGKKYFFMAITTVVCLPIGFFSAMESSELFIVILSEIGFGVLVGMIAGPQHAFLQDLFPTSNRYTGVAFSFCLGMALIGGNTPLMATYLIEKTGFILMPALLVSSVALITLTLFVRYQAKNKVRFAIN